jgi:hypothetical protein
MRPPYSLVLFFIGLVAPLTLNAAVFEGKVRIKMTAGQSGHEIEYSIKEGFLRTDMNAGKDESASMIMNFTKHEMTILMPQQKMYMVRPLQSDTGKTRPQDEATLEKTSETETILGYPCVKYIAKSKDSTADLWLTDKLGSFAGFGGGGGPMGRNSGGPKAQSWARALEGKDFFPLRVVSTQTKSGEKFTMEAVSVEKQTLPDSLFTPPEDYQDMGGMMRGLGGLMPKSKD